MSPIVWAVSTVVVAVAGYFLLLRVGRRVFTGKFRAETAAAAVVIAFIVGSEWPYGRGETPAVSAPVAAPVDAGSPLSGPLSGPRDVSDVCRSARLVAGAGKGNLDGARVRRTAVGVAPVELRAADELIIDGWAAQSDLSGTARGACPVVDGAIVRGGRVSYGAVRPDVAAAFGNPALTPSAFEIVLPARLIRAGRHRVQVAAVSADRSAQLVSGAAAVIGP
jgi:hypothetical protein